MKISAMILATLGAFFAVIPASPTSDETFVGQVAKLEDEAAVASSPNHSLRALAVKCRFEAEKCKNKKIWRCNAKGVWINTKDDCL
jgi:hypothetical protein